MKREELLQAAKPILFNTDMVRAILADQKKVTRRVVKLKYDNTHHEMKTDKYGTRLIEIQNDVEGETFGKNEDGTTWRRIRGYIEPKQPYKKCDILYVRETWGISNLNYDEKVGYIVYKASESEKYEGCRAVKLPEDKFEKLYDSMAENNPDWRPSIHMPKEATRIFLKVTDVRAERLQEITKDQARAEGCDGRCECPSSGTEGSLSCVTRDFSIEKFGTVWNSTIKVSDLDHYGWDANPWVWVIEFERVIEEKN